MERLRHDEVADIMEVAVKTRTSPLASGLVLATLVTGTVAVAAPGSAVAARPAPSVFGDPVNGGELN